MEKKFYAPKVKKHYSGDVYVHSGYVFCSGPVCNVVKGRMALGGGVKKRAGVACNSGIMIPDIKLPNTKTTVRLPLYRLVQYNHVPKTGSGIIPDIFVGTHYESLVKGIDYKMKVVKDLISNKRWIAGLLFNTAKPA